MLIFVDKRLVKCEIPRHQITVIRLIYAVTLAVRSPQHKKVESVCVCEWEMLLCFM